MMEIWGGKALETWVHGGATSGPLYRSISANGWMAERLGTVLTTLFEDFHKKAARTLSMEYITFPDEIIPSMLAYLDDKNPNALLVPWSMTYSPWGSGGVLWYEFKCVVCDTTRRMSLRHWQWVDEHIPAHIRKCQHLGVKCGERTGNRELDPVTETITRQMLNEAQVERLEPITGLRLPNVQPAQRVSPASSESVVVDINTTPVVQRGNIPPRENQTWMEEEEDTMYDNNTLSVLKALGRQGISIRSYDGIGGVTTLRAWMESVQRHLRLFNIKGGSNQVTLAVCFLEGRAREWWDKSCTTGAYREIQDLDQLYKAL